MGRPAPDRSSSKHVSGTRKHLSENPVEPAIRRPGRAIYGRFPQRFFWSEGSSGLNSCDAEHGCGARLRGQACFSAISGRHRLAATPRAVVIAGPGTIPQLLFLYGVREHPAAAN